MQSIAIIFMFLAFSLSIALSMDAPDKTSKEHQEAAPVIEETEAVEPAAESAAAESAAYQESAPVIGNETAASKEYQEKAPNIPGFGICPALSMLVIGFITLGRKYNLR